MTYHDDYTPRENRILPPDFHPMTAAGFWLYDRRHQLDLSRKKAAKAAGITVPQLLRLERGEQDIRSLRFMTVMRICSALRLDPFRFVSDEK